MKRRREPQLDQSGDRAWQVELTSRVAATVVRHGRDNRDFIPTLSELFLELERDPKQFPKMDGEMAGVRAAPLRHLTKPWRIPFILNEQERTVTVLIVEHGDALEARHRDAIRLRRRARQARGKQAVLGRL